MTKLLEIEGIGPVFAQKLTAAGVQSIEDLLEKGSTRRKRELLAEAADVDPKRLLRWLNMADLFRISGVGEQYADLLEAAGVDTVPELAQRRPEELHQKLSEANEARKLVRRLPSLQEVESWVAQASALPRVLEY